VHIQHEQAEAAAAKIGQFIKEIESQVGWTTQLPWSAGTIEQRRTDGQRLLRQVPAITELKHLALKSELAPDLPRARGDERRIAQVLLNLVGNAIKFTDTGEVAVRASAVNGSFTLAVRDTGPGISESDQGRIFEEFQQADTSITRTKGGTGLGLAISRRIVEMHGGRIRVESALGKGSTFFVTVPVRAEQEVAQPS
jgi:signal transduction histidine kinase